MSAVDVFRTSKKAVESAIFALENFTDPGLIELPSGYREALRHAGIAANRAALQAIQAGDGYLCARLQRLASRVALSIESECRAGNAQSALRDAKDLLSYVRARSLSLNREIEAAGKTRLNRLLESAVVFEREKAASGRAMASEVFRMFALKGKK